MAQRQIILICYFIPWSHERCIDFFIIFQDTCNLTSCEFHLVTFFALNVIFLLCKYDVVFTDFLPEITMSATFVNCLQRKI